MMSSTKRRVLSFFLLMVFITIMLAVTLPQLELKKGIPLWFKPGDAGQMVQPETPGMTVTFSMFMNIVIAIMLILMFIYMALKIRQKPNWKEILRVFLSFLGLTILLLAILFLFTNIKVSVSPAEPIVLPPEVAMTGEPLGPVPPYLLWLVWIGLGILAIILVFTLLKARIHPYRVEDPLVLEAEHAVQALKSGQDLRNVILRCYQQMSQILKNEQNLALTDTMTAREFESLLESRGVPNPPVRQLTRLFEIARYSPQPPGPEDEQNAINCLNAIIKFSQLRRPSP